MKNFIETSNIKILYKDRQRTRSCFSSGRLCEDELCRLREKAAVRTPNAGILVLTDYSSSSHC